MVLRGAQGAAARGLHEGQGVEVDRLADVLGGEQTRGVSGDRQLGAATHRGDERVDREGQELAGDDHQLVDGDDSTADALGRGLSEVDRNRGGGPTDGEAKDRTEDVHHPHVGGDGVTDGTDEEQDRQERDVVATAPAVGHHSAEESTECRAEEQDTGDAAFFQSREAEAVGTEGHVHVGQCAGDNARVITEEQGA